MRGKAVFYPVGWDDNGLPTERRVQNYYGVRCDPTLPYDPGFVPRGERQAASRFPISRRNFIELCERLTEIGRAGVRVRLAADRPVRGLVDDVPDDRRRRQSDLAAGVPAQPGARRGVPGRGPTLWDVTFRTAVAQADLEDREVSGA